MGLVAITDFATSFLAWYPGVQWNPSFGFGEGLGAAPMTGGLYVLRVKDLNGQPCEVNVGVLPEMCENLITHETLFYEPE